jgi:hypothetical protein
MSTLARVKRRITKARFTMKTQKAMFSSATRASDAGTSATRSDSFTTAFLVDQSPQEVFDVINDVRCWWSGDIEGRTDELGAEFTYRYQDLHCTTQKIVELVPGEKIAWHVEKSHIAFVDDKSEWDGTDIVFEIEKKGDKTEVRFTHLGLAPAIACYGRCSKAWGFYVNESLRNRITSGKRDRDERADVRRG